MIFIFVIFLALLIFKLWWDNRAKKSRRIINHDLSAIIDVIIYCASIFVFLGFQPIVRAIGFFLLLCTMRWTLFDIGFNLINNDKWNHTGNSARLDRILDRLDGAKDNVAKYGIYLKSIFICMFLFLILYSYV